MSDLTLGLVELKILQCSGSPTEKKQAECYRKVYKLRKALYGLKQAPRAWYSEIDTYLINCKFKKSTSEATLNTRFDEEYGLIIVSLYVDDIVYTSEFKREMMQKYEMSDLGVLHFLGMGILQTNKGVFIHQSKFDVCCQFIVKVHEQSHKETFGVAKRVLRYMQSTISYEIDYVKDKEATLKGSCDVNWAGSEDDSRSTSGYAFSFRSGVLPWASVKQNTVALSIVEAEYVFAVEATTQSIWLWFVLDDFGEM
ncbi:retrovirus-related Pol polyprotein from transposon TNT 1-94 [Pyrus ussuriensis x Pyrus communis]|uniref:Retrovirus-related Pol polyprotein from transposon TNT 1-94 n=1 Tax=Pyrus ussuriensis x Pyrus communis TaxID=2448454 RepID=A0A5N5HKQ0_9ROSA|nr:retrovirus-related Pol polyprotein from transposon TNT 1-94 [Pyrus ussuriensis x Pyrus communis]